MTTTPAQLVQQALVYEQERQASFANPPENCTHGMVYYKQGDALHCQYCDIFMYNGGSEYDD